MCACVWVGGCVGVGWVGGWWVGVCVLVCDCVLVCVCVCGGGWVDGCGLGGWVGVTSFPDHFRHTGKNWSGEWPIPFSFPVVAKIVT